MDQYIGKLLDNRYEILELIGTGGMAKVYKARCHRLNRLVAVKILREDLAQDAEFRRRFHDESQAVAMLSHPNIVAVYDVSRSSDIEYIVMELIDGITLKQYMQKKGGKLNWREALHFITQIVKALGHAHSRGIIHRDIKPHNVMVLRDGSVKVADFGIARVASGGHSTLTQEALGSVHYISPEQARGSHIDARSDLYSAGVVLYEMITGRLPFEGDTAVSVAIQHINSIPLSPREIDPTIPEALEEITMKAMAPNPDDRYADAGEMLADLEEFRKNPNINFDYNVNEFLPEEPDEDKTRIRPVTPIHGGTGRGSRTYSERRRVPGPDSLPYEEEADEPEPRGPRWGMIAGAAGILLFILVVGVVLYRTLFSGMLSQPQGYQVPNLKGQLYEDVIQDSALLKDHFTVVQGEVEEDDSEAGTILDQSPSAGSSVSADKTEITVTVSAGPQVNSMPNLADMEYRQAYIELDRVGIKTGDITATYENDKEVPKDHVISFTPLVDTPVAPGTKVQLVISLGPKTEQVAVPSLSERTLEQATSDLNTMNLTVGKTDKVHSDTVEAGKVVGQYPAAYTQVDAGTKVNLQISKGPDPASAPKEVTQNVDIDLPVSSQSVSVQVIMDGQVIFDESVDAAMNTSVSVPVTGTAGETKTLTVYFDGVRSSTFSVTLAG
ncbi:Stk1 family PASTA domain-containing Ser/Thr kinase [Colidextribacter sp. 210702-DFI.3.9]|nr:Stk1 family PASTA domain-containing Ser/Thr kinase [Colidextribacter sp. 210702-DFI.3.9]